jgi:hypothetical protein
MQDMERRFAMKTKVLVTLLLSAIATPILAGDAIERLFIDPAIQVAQLAPEERRMMRERWEQASPEERMAIRRQLQERLQQVPPEEREARRRKQEERWSGVTPEQRQRLREQRDQWVGRIPNPPSPADFAGAASNFGSGFEQRRPSQPSPDDNAANFDPHDRFNPSAGRNRR